MNTDSTSSLDGEKVTGDSIHIDSGASETEPIHKVEITRIYAEDQDRKSFHPRKMEELKATLKEHGQAQAIVVRPRPSEYGEYAIVVGERRWRAARELGWATIDARIRELDDVEAARLQWAENQGREDLNPIETAFAISRRIETEGWKHANGKPNEAEAARQLGMPVQTVRDKLRLLTVVKAMRDMIAAGQVSEGYGRAMADLNEDYQWLAIKYLTNMTRPYLPIFQAYCSELLARQAQVSFDAPEMVSPGMDVATSGATLPSAAAYPEHPDLPPVPAGHTVGIVLERYIAALTAPGATPAQREAARVLGHLYNGLRRANKIRS